MQLIPLPTLRFLPTPAWGLQVAGMAPRDSEGPYKLEEKEVAPSAGAVKGPEMPINGPP